MVSLSVIWGSHHSTCLLRFPWGLNELLTYMKCYNGPNICKHYICVMINQTYHCVQAWGKNQRRSMNTLERYEHRTFRTLRRRMILGKDKIEVMPKRRYWRMRELLSNGSHILSETKVKAKWYLEFRKLCFERELDITAVRSNLPLCHWCFLFTHDSSQARI